MRYITYKMSTDDYTLKIIQECEALGGKLTCHGSTDALLTAQSSLNERDYTNDTEGRLGGLYN